MIKRCMLKLFLFSCAVFLFGFQGRVLAESCSDCPRWESPDGGACFHHDAYGKEWGDFHCDQIRRLRGHVVELENFIRRCINQQREHCLKKIEHLYAIMETQREEIRKLKEWKDKMTYLKEDDIMGSEGNLNH